MTVLPESLDFEAALHGFPALFDLRGNKLADAEFNQWLEGARLHVTIIYKFSDDRRIEERAIFRQKPALLQDEWSWSEFRKDEVFRHFAVDLASGKASAEKREGKDVKRWSENLSVQSGQTFAGFGFTLAIKNCRERLVKGEKIELHAVAFTPKPRVVSVELSFAGRDQMRMGGRTIMGDRFTIHPKIPWIAKTFVDVKDTHIWLTPPRPSGFLRWEGPLVEPGDRVVRVDLLPGSQSGAAEPLGSH
jgi:hypothetical protein